MQRPILAVHFADFAIFAQPTSFPLCLWPNMGQRAEVVAQGLLRVKQFPALGGGPYFGSPLFSVELTRSPFHAEQRGTSLVLLGGCNKQPWPRIPRFVADAPAFTCAWCRCGNSALRLCDLWAISFRRSDLVRQPPLARQVSELLCLPVFGRRDFARMCGLTAELETGGKKVQKKC